MRFIVFIFILSFSVNTFANKYVGRVVKKQGKAQILFNPNKMLKGKGPHLLYEGKYYNYKEVRPGTKVNNGSILKTGADSRLKIVYRNGDQFHLGEGTTIEISWKGKNINKKSSLINVLGGKLRGIVSKKGPRNNLQVKSRSAVMGVRGTDFHFSQKGYTGTSNISVIRGEVKVNPPGEAKKVVNIKQGFSARLKKKIVSADKKTTKRTKIKKEETQLQIVPTTKRVLTSIANDSRIDEKKAEKIKDPKIKKQLKTLEAAAKTATLDDIKEYDKELYKELTAKNSNQIADINKAVLRKKHKAAPKKVKIDFGDIEDELSEDPYEKYLD